MIKGGRTQLASFAASDLLGGAAGGLPDGKLAVVAGDVALSGLERQPEKHNGYVNRLRQFMLEVASRFDVCIIDTNPNPDIRYAAALLVADFVAPVDLNRVEVSLIPIGRLPLRQGGIP